MNPIIQAYHLVLYQPLFNALIALYQYLPGRDFGVAIIVLTVLIRLVLYPLMAHSIKSQKALAEIQKKTEQIQSQFKNDKERQLKEIMALYQKEKVNPFGSLLPILVQLPILIALYQVFLKGIQASSMAQLYNFIPNPGAINSLFLGLIDLSKSAVYQIEGKSGYYMPALFLVVLSGIAQFIQTKMMVPKIQNSGEKKEALSQVSGMMQNQMIYFTPIFISLIFLRVPSALSLYLLTTSLFSIIQQRLILKKNA